MKWNTFVTCELRKKIADKRTAFGKLFWEKHLMDHIFHLEHRLSISRSPPKTCPGSISLERKGIFWGVCYEREEFGVICCWLIAGFSKNWKQQKYMLEYFRAWRPCANGTIQNTRQPSIST